MASIGNLTYIKTNGNKFRFTDKTSIKKIIFGNSDSGIDGVYSPDQNGTIYIKLKDYSIATNSSLGMVSIPEYLSDNETENGIKLSTDGKITVKFPIKEIKDGSNKTIEVNNSVLKIPNASEYDYGLIKIGENGYCIKADNGKLYVKFSEGWTDVKKEMEDINFEELIDLKLLSLENEYGD